MARFTDQVEMSLHLRKEVQKQSIHFYNHIKQRHIFLHNYPDFSPNPKVTQSE